MSKDQIKRLVELAAHPSYHGKWSRFALGEGLTKDQVDHQRRKLSLPMRTPKRKGPQNGGPSSR